MGGGGACLGGMVGEIAGGSVFCASSCRGGSGRPGGAGCRGGSGGGGASGGTGEMVLSWGSGIRARAGEAGTLGPGICDSGLARARAGDDSVEGSGASCWGSGCVECATGARRGVGRAALLGDAAWLLVDIASGGWAAAACPSASTVNHDTRPPRVSSTPRASTGRPAWRAAVARCWNTDE
ncbi:hypothetical protein EGT56_09300 [Arachnia propionica]|nr:hypothetical protein EGT56_09300 [Arachnia propionica]